MAETGESSSKSFVAEKYYWVQNEKAKHKGLSKSTSNSFRYKSKVTICRILGSMLKGYSLPFKSGLFQILLLVNIENLLVHLPLYRSVRSQLHVSF